MKRRYLYGWGLLAAALLRLAWVGPGDLHPDELCQYVQPFQHRLTGMGTLAWEYERGARNWLLPALNMLVWVPLRAVHVPGLVIHQVLQGLYAVVSVAGVVGAFRLGVAAARPQFADSLTGDADAWCVGMATATLTALFPHLVVLSASTLSDAPAATLLVWAFALWLEDVAESDPVGAAAAVGATTRWRRIGCLLTAAWVVRYSLLPVVAVVAVELLWRRRGAALRALLRGAFLPLAALGVCDFVTWGTPWHSVVTYFGFNVRDNGSALFGAQQSSFYWDAALRTSFKWGRWLLLVPLVCTARRQWRVLAAFVVPVLAFSCFPHKEARFIAWGWPLLFAGGAIAVLSLWRRYGAPLLGVARRWDYGVLTLVLAIALGNAWWINPLQKLGSDWYRAMAWVGSPGACGGVLTDFSRRGEDVMLDRAVLKGTFDAGRLEDRRFDCVAVGDPNDLRTMRERDDFTPAFRDGHYVVYKRL